MSRPSLIAAVAPMLLVTTANAAGVKLVYEIDKEDMARDSRMIRRVLPEVTTRLALDGVKGAKVSSSGENQVEVVLPDDDPKLVARTKRSVTRPGHVEFRILADTRVAEHAKAIELAKAQAADKTEVYNDSKKLVAKWVRISQSASAARTKTLVSRQDKESNDELLALIDDFNVTGEYISAAYPALGEEGDSVRFDLNEKGAGLFGELTAANIPDPVTGIVRELAIIVDDCSGPQKLDHLIS